MYIHCLLKQEKVAKMPKLCEFGRWLSTPPPGEEVVITGVAGRFPESNNVHEFRDNLFNKIDMVTDDDRRWKIDHPEIPQRNSKIHNIDKFDSGFFGIHHQQADIMDPAMRMLLETAVEAVIDAGVNPRDLVGSRTGVFIGACYTESGTDAIKIDIRDPQKFILTGYLRSLLAHRVSYYLKLKGPSYILDSACSSSLNALENAFRSIRMGECDSAIVGGVNLLAHPGVTRQFFRLGVLSYNGTCKVFDDKADGYVRGETIACVFLQKAKDSRRIYGQIVHSKVNDDGFKSFGITYPSSQMQNILMTDVLKESGIDPSDIDFLEAHGTGTPAGDPEEVKAIDLAIAKKRNTPLLVGSVKCSIGHTEPSSGLASLVKVIIAMESGYIPPNIHLNKVKIGMEGFEQGRMVPVTETTKLVSNEALIGINNFGFGGNNCHVLVKRFRKTKSTLTLEQDELPLLVCVSGRTKESVSKLLEDVDRTPVDKEHASLMHQMFRENVEGHPFRGFTILSNSGKVRAGLNCVSQQRMPFYVFFGRFEKSYKKIEEDMKKFPSFKSTIAKVNSILDDLGTGKEYDIVKAFSSQIAIVNLIKSTDLDFATVYGDSLGKLAVAYYYDELSLEEAVKVVCKVAENDVEHSYEDFFLGLGHDSTEEETIHRKCIVLNVSDNSTQFANEVLLTENASVTFLEVVGKLYQEGYNPSIHKLYPEANFPVSRRTPMISPQIKWDHGKRWYTYKFGKSGTTAGSQEEHNLSLTLFDDQKYLEGHVIDGRDLVPATEYLNLVWETFCSSQSIASNILPVVFEGCKFVRAVTIPKEGAVNLVVSIQRGSGLFEVFEKSSLVVSGRVFSPEDVTNYETDLPTVPFDESDRSEILEQDEIYRELYLRGYNYSGQFKGITKCNTDASVGLVHWENNWTTFIDKMLQLRIIQMDTRQLYVPVGIQRIVINPQKHLKNTEKEGSVLPVYCYEKYNVIKSKGVEITGVKATSITRRKQLLNPVLEKYVFVPNMATLKMDESVRVNTQIILENSLENNFHAVEILDDMIDPNSELVLPFVRDALDDMPLVTLNLIVSSKNTMDEILGITVENFVLTPTSNLLLIVTTNVFQRPTFLRNVLSALSDNGYVLTREELQTSPQNPEIEVVTEHVVDNEKLILFQKTTAKTEPKFIEVTSKNFAWLPRLQESLQSKQPVVLYGQNQEPEGLLGFVNCIRREPGGNRVSCVFTMDEAPQFNPGDPFYKNQIRKRSAFHIYKDGEWGTYRHLRFGNVSDVTGQHFYVNTLIRGDLSSLRWVEGPLTQHTKLGENQVMVFPYYCGINFKDIMIASGRVNVDAFTSDRLKLECLLGFEFSGIDISGRRVIGLIDCASMSTIVTANDTLLCEIPDQWSFEDAATVITVYMTVLYGLLKVIKLKKGKSILIHSATGGVGMAAINVCLYYGCDIYVTVGTQEKREYLKKQFPQIPENHMGNSRDTSFEEMVKKETKGRGVDIVLNSLSEEKLRTSVRCMAYGGDFLEIGKFDLGIDSNFNLLLLEKNVNYHGIMLDRIFPQPSREIHTWMVNAIYEGIKLGYVKPLPRVVFKRDEVEKAFRYMMTGKHMGKVLIQVRDEKDRINHVFTGVPRFCCHSEKTYIVVGGLGGFGLELADWLYLRGAKKLVLVSRSGIQSGYQRQRIRMWESAGVTVQVSTENVATKQGCLKLIESAKKLGPVDAIFNLAVVLKDDLFENQTEKSFNTSFAPKAQATMFLDQLSREYCPDLRHFVVFSSVSCGRGNPGQTNYGMANSVMERVCEKRKCDGLPGLAIQWGAIGDVGLVAKMQKENKELVIGGTLQQKVSSCLEVLDKFLNQNHPVVASMVVAEKNIRSYGSSAVDVVANILGIKDIKTVGLHTTLPELGLDSMMGTEIIQVLEREFEIYLTAKDVRNMTFAKLMEIEAAEGDDGKNVLGVNMLLQWIPRDNMRNVPLIKLPSAVKDDEVAPKVFILPGVEGIFEPLEPLAKKLKAHVFGIQYKFDDIEDSMEECCRNIFLHIEKMMTKEDKFHIVAYSYGSVVATELVALLETQGYSCDFIALDGSLDYFLNLMKNFLPASTETEFQTSVLLLILDKLLPAEFVSQKKDQLMSCHSFEERINLALSLIPEDTPHKDSLEKQGAIVLYKRLKFLFNYKFDHHKLRSSVHLFKAKFQMLKFDNDYRLGTICEKVPSVTTVEGNHSTILNDPQLVESINQLISE